MPRRARLEAPGTLHHVIIRGIERCKIVDDDQDRQAFVNRLGDLVIETKTQVFAWVLMTNHAHTRYLLIIMHVEKDLLQHVKDNYADFVEDLSNVTIIKKYKRNKIRARIPVRKAELISEVQNQYPDLG